MNKTIKSIINKLADGERSWVHDQLDGTSMLEESLAEIGKKVDQTLSEIQELLDGAIPEIKPLDMNISMTVTEHEKYMSRKVGIIEYQNNLRKVIK